MAARYTTDRARKVSGPSEHFCKAAALNRCYYSRRERSVLRRVPLREGRANDNKFW
ncbi:hypothetical protein ACYULU_12200 [Breznakiellaceae bacterium SP9]